MKATIAKISQEIYPRTARPADNTVAHLRGVTWKDKVVTANKGKTLVDGAHRLHAATLDGIKTIDVVDLGPMNDEAVLKAAIAYNAAHGKQLTTKDKQKLAAQLAATTKVAALTEMLAVSERSVSRWITEAKAVAKSKAIEKACKIINAGGSVTAAAKDVGVARGTLQGWLDKDELTEAPAEEKPKEKKVAYDASAEFTAEQKDQACIFAKSLMGECRAYAKKQKINLETFAGLVEDEFMINLGSL